MNERLGKRVRIILLLFFNLGYVVERKSGGDGQWVRAHPVDVRQTQVVLTNLEPGQIYQFRVKAINAIGWSLPSEESEPHFIAAYDLDSASRPSFVNGLRDTTVLEHEKVEMHVTAAGLPVPSLQWFLRDVPIDSSSKTIVITSGFNSSLVLNDVLAADEGEIRCIAVNELGSSTTMALVLNCAWRRW